MAGGTRLTRLLRATALLEAHRPDAALEELSAAIAESPGDASLHALAGLCHLVAGRHDAAEAAAREAVHLGPGEPGPHQTLARILVSRDPAGRRRVKEAEAHAEEALRLDPDDPDHHEVLARVRVEQERWADALAAAESGLRLDATHVDCSNLRSLALVQLGRKEEAYAAGAETLRRAPEDDVAHTVAGWGRLHAADARGALDHFREALRLDPTNESAKEGLVAALKARYRLYRWWLSVVLWLDRLGGKLRVGLAFGVVVGLWVLWGMESRYPEIEPFVLPMALLYGALVLMSWFGEPLTDLLLLLNPYGRVALSPDRRRAACAVSALLGTAVALGVAYAFLGARGLAFAAAAAVLLVFPVTATYRRAAGTTPRKIMAGITALLALAFAAAVPLLALADAHEDMTLRIAGTALMGLGVTGCIATTWLSVGLGAFGR